MNGLQVQILTGEDAGKTVLLTDAPVSFGRNVDNALVVDLPEMSRQHGRFEWDAQDDRWYLVNLSDNGTRLDRRLVRAKPRAMAEEHVVTVGETEVFRVTVAGAPANAPPPPVEPEDDPAAASREDKPRTKLWVGLGVYVLLMLLAIIIFSIVQQEDDPGVQTEGIRPVTADQIDDAIRQPLDPIDSGDRGFQEAVEQARRLFAAAPEQLAGSRELPIVYRQYRQALAHSQRSYFLNEADERRWRQVQDLMVQELTRQNDRAYQLLQSQAYPQAVRAYEQLLDYYDEPDELFQEWLRQRAVAQAALDELD
jgi:hypothetical protein